MSAERNTELCKLYTAGQTLDQLAATFSISKQRVRQIVIKGGVWKKKTPRPEFLGVDVTKDVKDKLKDAADERGVSMSKLASDIIRNTLEKQS